MQPEETWLIDMLRAARRCLTFTSGLSMEQFLDDEKTVSAVLHQLMVLGQATKRVSDEYRTAHTDLPWRQIAGTRDRLIHGYDLVDLEIVWRTVTDDLPPLVAALEMLVPPAE
ncbi:MAG: DUF86 domain-containing protein [Actinomycetota bacterium]